MSQSIIHSSTHADALENPSTAALDDLLDNDKDLPLLADTHLLSRVLLTVIAQQTSTPVKQTIDKLLNGEDPHQTIEAILPKLTLVCIFIHCQSTVYIHYYHKPNYHLSDCF